MDESIGKRAQPVGVRFRTTRRARGAAGSGEDQIAVASDPHPTLVDIVSVGEQVVTFSLWHPKDLPSADWLRLIAIEGETATPDGGHFITRLREQVRILMPDVPEELFERLTYRQLDVIGARSLEEPETDAANPPGGERDSAPSSRSPHGSTAGATPSSSV